MLTWDPPNNNGADITGYTVRSQNGYEKACGTTCTLDGLTNNVEYTFTVYATNAVGDGPASPASAVARPDEKPDPPAAPTLEFGDKSLTVTWTNKTYTDRSPIETVDLEISPAPKGGAVRSRRSQAPSTCGTGSTTAPRTASGSGRTTSPRPLGLGRVLGRGGPGRSAGRPGDAEREPRRGLAAQRRLDRRVVEGAVRER